MARLRCALVLALPAALLGLALLPLQAGERGTTFAFLVGCSNYLKTEFNPLPTPTNDMTAFRDALVATGCDPECIVMLYDEAKDRRFLPEKAKIFAQLNLLLAGMQPEDTLIVALSGHGLQYKGEKVSYFVPVDGKVADKSTLIPLDGQGGLYERLRACKAKKKLLLVNACRKNVTSSLEHAANRIELAENDHPDDVPEGIAALYSCQAGQLSYYGGETAKRSFFFEHVARAWKGEYARDGKVTLEQFFHQVISHTKTDANNILGVKQVPEVLRAYRGEWVISAVRTAKPSIPKGPTVPAPAPVSTAKATLHVAGELTDQDAPDREVPDCFCKVFPFYMQQGKAYRIELRSRDFDAFLRLEDPAGKSIVEDHKGLDKTDARILHTAKVTGDHRIVVTTWRGKEKGRFTLDADAAGVAVASKTPVAPPVKPPVAPPITPTPPGGVLHPEAGKPAQVASQLTTGDPRDGKKKYFKVFPAYLQAGVKYHVLLKGQPPLDVYVKVEDQAGKVLKEDEFGEAGESGLRFQPFATGTYRIVATTFKEGATGSFTLTVSTDSTVAAAPKATVPPMPLPAVPPVPAATPGVLAIPTSGQLVSQQGSVTAADGRDAQGRQYKAFTFQGQAGRVYQFEMVGQNGFDPLTRVETTAGAALKEEDYGDGKVSRLAFQPSQSGTYRVVAGAFKPGATGTFVLTARVVDLKQAASNTLVLNLGRASLKAFVGNQDGTDKDGKHYKVYTLAAQAGKIYRVEMLGHDGLDPAVRVEDQNGKRLKEEDYGDGKVSRLFFQPYQAGAYRVIVSTFKPGQSGNFTLEVEEKAAGGAVQAQALVLDKGRAAVQSQLTAADATIGAGKFIKEYTFQAQAGKTYQVDLHSTAFDAYLYLKDAGGNTIAENDDYQPGVSLDSRIVYKAEKTGTYRLVATSLTGGQTGAFTLTVATQSDGPERLAVPSGQPLQTPGRLTAADPRDNQGHHFHAFVFRAEAGRSYRFEMRGVQGLDPLLRVEDGAGKLLKEEDFGDGEVSRLVFTAPQAGDYRIIVAGFKAGATGNYVLSASQVGK